MILSSFRRNMIVHTLGSLHASLVDSGERASTMSRILLGIYGTPAGGVGIMGRGRRQWRGGEGGHFYDFYYAISVCKARSYAMCIGQFGVGSW